MKKYFFILSLAIMTASCGKTGNKGDAKGDNPFFSEFSTPHGVPPFDKIRTEHYMPAFEEAMKQHSQEIEAIVSNKDKASFDNTIVAMDRAGEMLDRVAGVFFAIKGANTNNDIDSIAIAITPKLTEHGDNISLNADLFKRIEAVKKNDYEGRSTEDKQLIDKIYKSFVRSGIALDDKQQTRMREINKEMSELSLNFGNNVLKETSSYELVIDSEKDLAGLPAGLVASAAEVAKKKGHEGKWVFTLDGTSWEPFVQYSENRALRQKLFTAMNNRANNGNEFDNKKNIERMVSLRLERANLLGYSSHADYALDETMAKTPANVNKLLSDIWQHAIPKAKEETKDLLAMAKKGGDKVSKIEPWDWWYYSEKVRKEKYNLDEEDIKPYLVADNVRSGVFAVANKLYGINFNKIEVPVYQEDVEAFEVTEPDGSLVGVIYFDSYARSGAKRPGAWMGSFRKQSVKDGKQVYPIVYNVGNYNPPSDGKPALLSLDQVETMFHEFGHGLHGLLSQCTYNTLSGTSVSRDFVELPSQIMEHWAFQPEVMKMYAKHYQTGEVIPDALIEKVQATSTFNQGFRTTELVAAAMLDMAYYTMTSNPNLGTNKIEDKAGFDVAGFEKGAMKKAGLVDEIIPRYRSTYFQHIFSGGYSSGYYSYLWSEVLDSDAFQAFEEKGLFDQGTAKAFRENVLSKGGSDEPMTLYKNFRGAEPDATHLLKNRGLVN